MKHNIILEIDGVRHKLIKTRAKSLCKSCSIKSICGKPYYLTFPCSTRFSMHFCKCKPGE